MSTQEYRQISLKDGSFSVTSVEDSISIGGSRLTTLSLRYPRFIHAELMTHRVFSRNASSSRAIPVMKVLAQVWNDPAMPIHWGSNQPGMQASEQLTGWRLTLAKAAWRVAGKVACGFAYGMVKLNLHKQVANRILEPWQLISVVLTGTDWYNFFKLRDHEAAQPEFRKLTRMIKAVKQLSFPVLRGDDPSNINNWHLPYVTADERATMPIDDCTRISAARCARVSYLTHEGTAPVIKKDLELYQKLIVSKPAHASPVEHQGYPTHATVQSGNFRGWIQFRKLLGV